MLEIKDFKINKKLHTNVICFSFEPVSYTHLDVYKRQYKYMAAAALVFSVSCDSVTVRFESYDQARLLCGFKWLLVKSNNCGEMCVL